jgi:type IX secretion system PorP/SprF family membrane protein
MKRIIETIILLLIPMSLAGQLAPVTSQYVLNPLSINPAFAGNRGALNVAAFYRRQWAGVTGSPETMTLAADAPFFDSKVGFGLTLVNDKLGVTKETHILTNYSYRIQTEKGTLSLGLGAGLITTNSAWSKLIVLDQGDENYLIDSRVYVVPDFSFGVYYSDQNFFGGISIPKLLGYRFNVEQNKYTVLFSLARYSYLLNAGYKFDINKNIKFFPSTLISFTPKEKVLFDLNAYVSVNNVFWTGISYRNGRSVGALIQFAINNQLKIAYNYDFTTGSLGHFSNGSHEIMLRYEFHYKVEAVSPLNF